MALTMNDQRKLLDAGFILFRLELGEKKIKRTKRPGCWRTYQNYQTQAGCQRAWGVLMANDLYISA